MPKYATLLNGVVDVISYDPPRDEAGDASPPWIIVGDDVFGGFVRNEDGTFTAPPAPPPRVEDYQSAIQSMVDETARSKLFNDGVTLASYVNSTVEPWAAQAVAFVAWRDSVWQYAYSELAKVQGGVREQPPIEAFLLELPGITWP